MLLLCLLKSDGDFGLIWIKILHVLFIQNNTSVMSCFRIQIL